MMGKQEARVPLFLPGFDLGSRVRPDRPLRRVKAAVDFGFVRACVADRYGYNGNVSVDPEVVLKLVCLAHLALVVVARARWGVSGSHGTPWRRSGGAWPPGGPCTRALLQTSYAFRSAWWYTRRRFPDAGGLKGESNGQGPLSLGHVRGNAGVCWGTAAAYS